MKQTTVRCRVHAGAALWRIECVTSLGSVDLERCWTSNIIHFA